MKEQNKESRLLVVIPAYNEEQSIRSVVEDIETNCPWADYLIVNDGSSDSTLDVCLENGFHVIDLPVNLGLAGSFQTGVRYALKNGYKYVVQFDGDGQHLAEYIAPMLECARTQKCNIVIASRYINGQKGMSLREVGSVLISLCIFLATGKKIKDPTSGMRLYDESVMERLALQMNYAPEPDTLAALLKKGSTVCEIPARMRERLYGASYLTFTNAVKYMIYTCMSILVVHWLR